MVISGVEAWASGKLEDFGKLVAASGRSSIVNYECGMPRLSYIKSFFPLSLVGYF